VKSAGAPSTDIAGLYSALLKAGIVAVTGMPVGAGATVTSEDTAAAPSTSSENLSRWSPKNTPSVTELGPRRPCGCEG
jgi:pre-mRNA cleavage complex 2 protein Pcf11